MIKYSHHPMEASPQFVGLFGFIFVIANECIAFFAF